MKSTAFNLTRIASTAAVLAAFQAVGFAQALGNAADQDFAALEVAARPLPIAPLAAGQKKTHEDFVRDQKMQSAAFVAAAKQAHDFYTKYPSHAKASEAKKIEAISMLRAANTGSAELEPTALRLAREFRSDNANKSADRFQVAMTVTQIDILKKHLKEKPALMAEYEKRAGDLYGEFPDEPAVFDLFVGIARNADEVQARSVANQILRMPATARAKEEAQAVLDRLDMPGKPISLEWQDENGKFYKSSDFKGKTLVFYVWSSSSDGPEERGGNLSSLPANVVLVSVNVDTDVTRGKAAKSKATFVGISYYDDRGLNGPLAKQLRAAKAPAVHVVDSKGTYVGMGAPADLPALLAAAK